MLQNFNVAVLRKLTLLQAPKAAAQPGQRYSELLFDKGKAEENVHFLKVQREQLINLRKKLLKAKTDVQSKMSELDEKIEYIKKKDETKQNTLN